MADLIEKIGPYLGIVAFGALAVLAFLIFQQAREVRRLRDWAGRAPERATEAAEATAAAAEARGAAAEAEPPEAEARPRGRLGSWWHRVRARFAAVFEELDRRSPVDPRWILAGIAALAIAAGVLTGGFGIGGGDSGDGGGGGKHGGGAKSTKKTEVAVLNATQENAVGGTELPGVQGLAKTVADAVVKPAGFKTGEETNAASGFGESVIMFEPGAEPEANELAKAIEPDLGPIEVTPMIGEVRDLAGGAPVALVVGRDDSEFTGSGGSKG